MIPVSGRSSAPDRPSSAAAAPALSPREADYWLNEFRDLADAPETREALGPAPAMLTDAEIAELEREIEREFG